MKFEPSNFKMNYSEKLTFSNQTNFFPNVVTACLFRTTVLSQTFVYKYEINEYIRSLTFDFDKDVQDYIPLEYIV